MANQAILVDPSLVDQYVGFLYKSVLLPLISILSLLKL